MPRAAATVVPRAAAMGVPRAVLRRSCCVQLCNGHAACGTAMAVPRARFCDGRAVLRRACRVRSCNGAATVVPRTVVRDS